MELINAQYIITYELMNNIHLIVHNREMGVSVKIHRFKYITGFRNFNNLPIDL